MYQFYVLLLSGANSGSHFLSPLSSSLSLSLALVAWPHWFDFDFDLSSRNEQSFMGHNAKCILWQDSGLGLRLDEYV